MITQRAQSIIKNLQKIKDDFQSQLLFGVKIYLFFQIGFFFHSLLPLLRSYHNSLQTKYNINQMRRVPKSILFVVTPKTKPILSTQTLHQFVNRIPCKQEDLLKQSDMTRFVDKEMEDYPIPKKIVQVKLKEDVKVTQHRKSKSAQIIKYAYDFVNTSNYHLIEETRWLLHSLNDKEISENEITLQMLRKSVSECIIRDELNDFEMLEILELLEEINKIQNKKSSKLV